jgi:DNA repair exonuclease SbcCD ATPase subunit
MKSVSALVLLIGISCHGVMAQMPVTLTTDSLKLGKGSLPAISVTIPEVTYENTLKSWIRELESGTKSKVITENGEMSIFGAKVKDVSPNPINVYSKLVKLDSILRLTVSFELKKDQYAERLSLPSEFAKAEVYLKEFAKSQYIDLVKDQVNVEEKKTREIEKELSSLEKEKTNLQKSIESLNNDIVTENGNLTVLNNEVTALSNEIVEENKQLSSITDEPTKKAKNDYINGLEKKKKKVQNSIESAQNKINKSNNEIDKAKVEIPKNERMQEQVSSKIEKQQAVLGKFNDKLKKIKSY